MRAWGIIAALAVGTAVIKAAGPLTLGHLPSRRLSAVIASVAPALLAALVVYETFSRTGREGSGLAVDSRVAGLAAAAIALRARLPLTVVIVSSAAATAAVRALG